MSFKQFMYRACTALSILVCTSVSAVETDSELTHRLSKAEKQRMPAYLAAVSQGPSRAVPQKPRSIAEFEPVEAVIIAYPGEFGFSLNLVEELTAVTEVILLVSSSQENSARSALQNHGIEMDSITIINRQSDSYWTRDYGPWCIDQGDTTVAVVDFTYNRPRYNDNGVPAAMAEYFDMPLYDLGLTHCGGNYMSSSGPDAVSTDLVVDENSSLGESGVRTAAQTYLGIDDYHITPDPLGDYIKHVDCWGKYLGPDKILIGEVSGSQKAAYDSVAAYFAKQISPLGTPYEVYRVYTDGEPYTNSIIVNDHVFVPTQGTGNDPAALETYRTAMPGYTVVGVRNTSSTPWQSTDALHCRVKGLSDRQMLRVVHSPRRDTISLTGMADTLFFELEDFSGTGIDLSNSQLQFTRGETEQLFGAAVQKSAEGEWFSIISFADTGYFDVTYAVSATNNAGKKGSFPLMGMADPCSYTAHVTKDETESILSSKSAVTPPSLVVRGNQVHAAAAGVLRLHTPAGRLVLHTSLQAGQSLRLPADLRGAHILSFSSAKNDLRRMLVR
ncbi:MAG: agmatine deiminase family protein [Fibrobacterota bacterium]